MNPRGSGDALLVGILSGGDRPRGREVEYSHIADPEDSLGLRVL